MRALIPILAGFILVAPALAQDETVIRVTGYGVAERFPNRAVLTLRVQTSDTSSAKAMAEYASTMRRVVNRVRAVAGVQAEVHGGAPTLWSRYWRRPRNQKPSPGEGFVSKIQVTLTPESIEAGVAVLDVLKEFDPDQAISLRGYSRQVTLTLEGEGETAADALEAAKSRMQELRDELARLGIGAAELTLNYNIGPNTDDRRSAMSERPREFNAWAAAEVRLDSLTLLTQVIDAVQHAGATVTRVQYVLRDYDAAMNAAYAQAVENARDHAEALAAAAGVELGEILRIEMPTPRFDSYMIMENMSAEPESEQVRPPTPTEVTARITVEYGTRHR